MRSWLELAAARHPDRVAVEGLDRSLTYVEMLVAARRSAARLAGEGSGPVAVALAPGVEWAVILHGCLLAGRPVQPVDQRLSEAEQAVRRRGATTLVDAAWLGRDPLGGFRDDSEHFRGHSAQETTPSGAGARLADPNPDPGPLAVMHTSGTTAEPKQIPLTAGNFLASALGSAVALGLDPDERWLCPMPLTHVGGLSILVRSAIYATTTVLPGRFELQHVLRELSDPARRITLVSLVPTMLTRLLDAGLRNPPSLRWALLGGAAIPEGLLARAAGAGVAVAPTYGMTEACSQIATFGLPLSGVEIALAEDGEIRVRGPIVSSAATAPDGWLHTGDLGEMDAAGRLRITGRKADTIVSGGENVAPSEVEDVLAAHPAVDDAGVWARPDAEWGEAIVATVVLRHGAAASPEQLREWTRARLAAFKVPKEIRFAPALPRTASGKLLRRELPPLGRP